MSWHALYAEMFNLRSLPQSTSNLQKRPFASPKALGPSPSPTVMDSQTTSPSTPRRFAPLNASIDADAAVATLPQLQGIVFDVDGTLCGCVAMFSRPNPLTSFFSLRL
jgi:hypothetical protein